MNIQETEIADTFADAFPLSAAALVVTAADREWATTAAQSVTGYATSVIGCDAEMGIESELTPDQTPDGRPGVRILTFAFSRDALQKALMNRVAQCVLTCPTTACYNDLHGDPEKRISVGGNLRYFGDGFQISKLIETAESQRRFWRVPVMDGEFICEDLFDTVKGVAGGNFLILGDSQLTTLSAAKRAVDAIQSQVPGTICPFPGGVVRSGSKVGSKYPKLKASTNEAYCPTLKGVVKSELPDGVNAVYEIVIDGLDLDSVRTAMKVGIETAAGPGILKISAGNYGGKLGPHHIQLHELFGGADS